MDSRALLHVPSPVQPFVEVCSIHSTALSNCNPSPTQQRPAAGRALPAMSTVLDRLPAPQRQYERPTVEQAPAALATRGLKEPPAYGRRQGFVPRRLEDFGDG